MRVNAQINSDYTRFWSPGDIVIIEAGTGCGKTYFVTHTLRDFVRVNHRDILFLCNRTTLRSQIVASLCEQDRIPLEDVVDDSVVWFDGICVTSYQYVAEWLSTSSYYQRNCQELPRSPMFIVCDEAHFFIKETSFNPKTQVVYNWVWGQIGACIIFMTATTDGLIDRIMQDGHWNISDKTPTFQVYQHVTRRTYCRFNYETQSYNYDHLFHYRIAKLRIDVKLLVYDSSSQMCAFVNGENRTRKSLWFVKSKEEGRKIRSMLKCESDFFSSEEKTGVSMQETIASEKFAADVLLATAVIDTGVNFKDPALKRIIVDQIDEATFLQMIGRKRFGDDEDRSLEICVRRRSLAEMQRSLWRLKQDLALVKRSPMDALRAVMHNEVSLEDYQRFFFINGDQLVKGEWSEEMIRDKMNKLKKIIGGLEEDPEYFVKLQIEWLEGANYQITEVADAGALLIERKVQDLRSLVDTCVGRDMNKSEQDEFRKRVKEICCGLPEKRTGLSYGAKTVKDVFERYCPEIELITIPGKKKGEETKWRLKQNI